MATIQEILAKVTAGTATASDFEELAKLSTAEATNKKKIEDKAKALIDEIKKAKIEPKVLTNILAQEGLIVLPEVATEPEKVVILEESIRTEKGRDSKFKIWIDRDVKALTGDAKKYWEALHAKGKDYFIKNLNSDGNAYYESQKGKAWIDGLFATAK